MVAEAKGNSICNEHKPNKVIGGEMILIKKPYEPDEYQVKKRVHHIHTCTDIFIYKRIDKSAYSESGKKQPE